MRLGAIPIRSFRILAAASVCAFLGGCSAAGAGSPVGPPAASAREGSVQATLQGRVIDQQTGLPLGGIRVTSGGATAWTDAAGTFSLDAGAGMEATFSGAGYYDRTTALDAHGLTWALVPRSFDMRAFDDVARDHSDGTLRWVSAPDIYVDDRAHGVPAGTSVPETWVAQVVELAPRFVAAWTGGAIRARSVTVGSTPPPAGTPGVIVVSFDEDPARYPTVTAAGSAIASWDTRGVIRSASVRFRFRGLTGAAAPLARQAVIGHEFGHALGLAHMDGATSSMMAAVVRTPELTSFDRAAGALLYDRQPGNRADDRDFSPGILGATTLASR